MKVQDLSSWFASFIGEGKRFSTRAEAARDLGLPKSKATKFFDFLDGKDTGYTSVLDWFEKMGGVLHTPNDDPTREVVFINPRIHESFNGLPAPARHHAGFFVAYPWGIYFLTLF